MNIQYLCVQADALTALPTGLPVHRQVAVQAGLIPPETNTTSLPDKPATVVPPALVTNSEDTAYPTEPSPPTSEENSPRPNFNLASAESQATKDNMIKSSKLTVSVLQLFLIGVSVFLYVTYCTSTHLSSVYTTYIYVCLISAIIL